MDSFNFVFASPLRLASSPNRHRLRSSSHFISPLRATLIKSTPALFSHSSLACSMHSQHASPSSPTPHRPRFGASLAALVSVAFIPFLPARAYSASPQSPASYSSSIHSHSHLLSSSSVTPPARTRLRAQPSCTLATTVAEAPHVKISPVRVILPSRADSSIHRALKFALLAGISIFAITAATIAVFWVIQDSLVYKPTKVWRGSPKSSGMPYFDNVSYCTVDGAEISGWFIKQSPEQYVKARTLLYFHGTDKNASFRLRKVIGFYEQCKCNILLLSYRGYGLSTGKPNEKGVRIDAESAYDYLKSRGDIDVGPQGNLWVYGESLGGAVAVHFSNVHQNCIRALILENTFTSLLDMIKLEFPILGIFRYLSRNRWQSKKRIGDLRIPLLFLSGLKDSYIPPAMMKQMHALAVSSQMKEFVEFEKGTHNRTWTMDGFYESVARFMDRVEKVNAADSPLDSRKVSLPRGVDDNGRFATAA